MMYKTDVRARNDGKHMVAPRDVTAPGKGDIDGKRVFPIGRFDVVDAKGVILMHIFHRDDGTIEFSDFKAGLSVNKVKVRSSMIKMAPCRNFAKGTCRFGAGCFFLHDYEVCGEALQTKEPAPSSKGKSNMERDLDQIAKEVKTERNAAKAQKAGDLEKLLPGMRKEREDKFFKWLEKEDSGLAAKARARFDAAESIKG